MRRRRYEHLSRLRKGTHRNRNLQALWDTHGEASFQFRVLTLCRRADVLHFEQLFIDILPCDLNIHRSAYGSAGAVRTEDARRRMGDARRGKRMTEAHRRAISAGMMGRVVSPETRLKLAAQKGWKHSEETKAKMRAAKAAKRALVNG